MDEKLAYREIGLNISTATDNEYGVAFVKDIVKALKDRLTPEELAKVAKELDPKSVQVDFKDVIIESVVDYWYNGYDSVSDLPKELFSDLHIKMLLEWFARKIVQVIETIKPEWYFHTKSYDPLVIDLETNTAHSYVFELGDGGRHHSYESLEELEERLVKELTYNCVLAVWRMDKTDKQRISEEMDKWFANVLLEVKARHIGTIF